MNISKLAKKAINLGELDPIEIDFLKSLSMTENDDLSFPRAMIEEMLPEVADRILFLNKLKESSEEEWKLEVKRVLNFEKTFNFFKFYFLTDQGRLHEVISCFLEKTNLIRRDCECGISIKQSFIDASYEAAKKYYGNFDSNSLNSVASHLFDLITSPLRREVLEVNSLSRQINNNQFINPESFLNINSWVRDEGLFKNLSFIFKNVSPACLFKAVETTTSDQLVKVMSLVAARNDFYLLKAENGFEMRCGLERQPIAKDFWVSYSAATLQAATQGLLVGEAAIKTTYDLLESSRVMVEGSVITVLVDYPKLCMPFAFSCGQSVLTELKEKVDTGWYLTSNQNDLILNEHGKEIILDDLEKNKIGFAVLEGCLFESRDNTHFSRMALSCFEAPFFKDAIGSSAGDLYIKMTKSFVENLFRLKNNQKISRSERLLLPYLVKKDEQRKLSEKIKKRNPFKPEKMAQDFVNMYILPFGEKAQRSSPHEILFSKFHLENIKNGKDLRSQDFLKKATLKKLYHPLLIYKNNLYEGGGYEMPSSEDFAQLIKAKEHFELKARFLSEITDRKNVCAL